VRNFMMASIGSLFTFIFTYFIGIQAVQIIKLQKYEVSLDLSLLFFDGRGIWFTCLTIIAILISVNIFMSFFFHRKGDRRRSKDDRINFSHLARKHEAKKGLLRIEVSKKGVMVNTPLQVIDELLNPLKIWLNKILTLFKVKDINKFNTMRTWNFAGTTVCKRGGLPIYMPRLLKNRVYVDPDDTHSIILGATGSGKTESMLMSMIVMLIMLGESLVIADPKGELYKKSGNRLKKNDYDVITLNFIDPEHSDWWNPFELVWSTYAEAKNTYDKEMIEWELERDSLTGEELENFVKYAPELDISKAVEYLEDIANILTFNKESKDPFWNEATAKTIVGFALLLLKQNDPELLNAKNILMLVNQADMPIPNEIKKKYDIKANTLLAAYLEKFEGFDSEVSLKLSDYATGAPATQKSIRSVLTTSLRVLTSNEQIMRATSRSNFKMTDLEQKKMAIFLVVHDEKKTYHPLVTLFIKQLYEQLIGVARKNSDQRLLLPLNILLEEAGNCPPFKDVDSMLSAARSRGIRFTFVLQAFSQLVELYGKEMADTIETNCTNTVFLMSSNEDTLKKMSEMCGKHQVWLPARNMYESRPLISQDRLQHLNMGEVVVHRQRKNAFITRMVPYSKTKFYDKTYADLPKKEPMRSVKSFNLMELFNEKLKTLPAKEEL